MGLDISTCSESLPIGLATLNPQSTCHGPRPGPKLGCGVGAGSVRPTEPRVRGKTGGRKRKNAEGPKKHIYTCVQGFRDVLKWIPGVTQVENGHAGNTAVATAYLCWVKHGNRNSRTGVPVDYYYQHLLWTLICYLFVAFVSETFFGSKKSSNWLVSLTIKDCRECKPASNVDCRGLTHIVRALWGFW